MKNILKKMFFVDAPAQGAFAGTTMLLVSLWLAPALYLLCDGLARPWVFRGNPQALILLLPVPAFLYWLILFIRFHRSEILCKKPKWNSPGMLVSLAFLLAAMATAPWIPSSYGIGYGFCFLLVLPVWVMPPASMPRYWKYWLPRAFCWTGAFWCADHFLKCLRLTCSEVWVFYMRTSMTTIWDGNYTPGKDLMIVYLGVILFIAGYLLSAKMYAAAGIPFKKIFGLPVKIMLGIWATVYLISGGMAVVQHRAAERTAAELGEFFGYPLNADGLNALLRKNGWGITAKPFIPHHYLFHPYLTKNNVVLPKKLRQQWQAEIEGLTPLKEWERDLDKPFRSGFFPMKNDRLDCAFSYHSDYRSFFWLEWWKIVFLLEKNDPAEALKVLHRMENALEFYRRNPINMHELLWNDAHCRLNVMELLLADGRVPDPELKRWSADLEQREKEIPERERLSIYMHTVRINCLFYRLAHGDHSLPLYPLRWLYPPAWYYAELDRKMSLSRFRHNRYSKLPYSDYNFGIGRFYSNLPVQIMTRNSRTLTAKYRAMRALIGVELEKRRTGKYPDQLENPPVDPFTGKPMFYKKGKMPLLVKVWNPALGKLIPERREADGIAVWSLGWNRKSEQGQDQAAVREYADDVRAKMIFKKEDAN
ncbi:MAG: hypothetical protein E7055_08840 [Lentisphaerae bacterium]|nr:hypothetical protein [Lentisphaerota bacterium]